MFPRRQPGLNRPALPDDWRGQSRDALCAAPLHGVFGAMALHALAVDALSTPWRPHETTTIRWYGASAAEARPGAGPGPPRPASGPRQAGRDELPHVLRSLGVSRAGRPRRLDVRAGHTRASPEPPVAMEAGWARGRAGVRGLVAARQASGQRPLGWCRAGQVGLITWVPRPCAVRPAGEPWGQPQGALP